MGGAAPCCAAGCLGCRDNGPARSRACGATGTTWVSGAVYGHTRAASFPAGCRLVHPAPGPRLSPPPMQLLGGLVGEEQLELMASSLLGQAFAAGGGLS